MAEEKEEMNEAQCSECGSHLIPVIQGKQGEAPKIDLRCPDDGCYWSNHTKWSQSS